MLYKKTDCYELRLGTMQEELLAYDSNSIDSIVTDPPYELGFMGKSWDSSGVAFQKETWEHCYRVLKPGGYLLAFGGSRTYHRIACAIEDAGFEIRDTIMWLYGSGFPKSMNIGLAIDKKNGVESTVVGYSNSTSPDFKDQGQKQKEISGVNKLTFGQVENAKRKTLEILKAQNEWDGWGTCLKPAYEPIIVARKPFNTSLVENIETYKVGGINIDECRVPFNGDKWNTQKSGTSSVAFQSEEKTTAGGIREANELGRFPANVILTYDDSDFNEVCNGFPNTKSTGGSGESSIKSGLSGKVYQGGWNHEKSGEHLGGLGDEGSAARYFYCAKASKKDRDEGCGNLPVRTRKTVEGASTVEERLDFDENEVHSEYDKKFVTHSRNIHPTVKPTELMQYLVRLVSPRNATILDPFMGSGSTGKAVMLENKERNKNYKFIGIEMTEEYLPICEARINFGMNYEVEFVPANAEIINEVKKVKEDLW